MLYSDLLVLKFFRDIVVYEKITLIKKLFSPFNTVSHFNVSIHARTLYNTLYNPRSLKRDNTFGFEQNFVQKFGFKTKHFPQPRICLFKRTIRLNHF